MILEFAKGAYNRSDVGLPQARLQNFYVEKTEGGPSNDARLPRPGLAESYLVGAGPIRGAYQQKGVFGGDRFFVSGSQVYRETTLLGAIIGDGPARFAASATQLVIVSGGSAYLYDGVSFGIITDPDLPSVSDVTTLAGRFIYTELDTDRFYWSVVNDAQDIDGLAFATAEGSPDANVAMGVLGDELFFFGQVTTEMWFPTGDQDAPYQRTQGRRFERGCASQTSVAVLDNALFWVGNDRIVYRSGNVPNRVSTHGIEESLRKCSTIEDCTGFYVTFDGHSFYVLGIPDQATYAYDVATQEWAEWTSYGRDTFRVTSCVMVDGQAFMGDSDSGQIWTFDPERYTDGSDVITGLVSCFYPKSSGVEFNFMVGLQAVRGVGNGAAPDPIVEMRYSDDGGREWSNWRQTSAGKIGEYGVKGIWRKLAQVRNPGRGYEFRITDPVLKVLSYAVINEQRFW